MPRRLVTGRLVILPGFLATAAHADLPACRALTDPAARLACYDALPLSPTTAFQGQGSGMAGPFTITGPQTLEFESDDAILVAYLLDDATGSVVKNLHHGGAGAGHFLIEAPGRYRVQINASGGWRIRLSPP